MCRQFRMGDKVTIKVVAANLEKRQLDYEWVPGSEVKAGKGLGRKVVKAKKRK